MGFCDTIAAISTPYGKGGVAVIRITGDGALAVAQKIFVPKNGRALADAPDRYAVYGSILCGGEPIDDGIATAFRAPRSFTGEDTVEITCHGGVYVTGKVLTAAFLAGARAAEPGEFTRRAFVHGKMGLSRAEALAGLLDAGNDDQLKLARSTMNGAVERACDALYDDLVSILADTYAAVDFPEEDLASHTIEETRTALLGVRERLDALIATYRTGHAVGEGVRTVIVGRPNVGKSSIYNRLVGRDAAIVTATAGTTRDLLRERVTVGKVTLDLCDTAGLRETDEEIERLGVARTREALADAELLLAVFDGADAWREEDASVLDDCKPLHASKIAIINKKDEKSTKFDLPEGVFAEILCVSAKTGEGFDELARAIERRFVDDDLTIGNDAILANAREHAQLLRAREHLDRAVEGLDTFGADVAGIDVELAMTEIGRVDGRSVGEDVVAEIFSHFCVGK